MYLSDANERDREFDLSYSWPVFCYSQCLKLTIVEQFNCYHSQSLALKAPKDAHNIGKDWAKVDIKMFILGFKDCWNFNMTFGNFRRNSS